MIGSMHLIKVDKPIVKTAEMLTVNFLILLIPNVRVC